METRLTDRLGSISNVRVLLDDFQARLIKDPLTAQMYDGVKPMSMRAHHLRLMNMGFNEKLDVAAVEKFMANFIEDDLTGKHYDAIIRSMVESFNCFDLEQSAVTEAINALGPLRIAFCDGFESFSSIHSAELESLDSSSHHNKSFDIKVRDSGPTLSLSKRFYKSLRKHANNSVQ